MSFADPRDLDEQKAELIRVTEEEHYRYIHPKDLERINYYLTTVNIDSTLAFLTNLTLINLRVRLFKRSNLGNGWFELRNIFVLCSPLITIHDSNIAKEKTDTNNSLSIFLFTFSVSHWKPNSGISRPPVQEGETPRRQTNGTY